MTGDDEIFDRHARTYNEILGENVKISGEEPAFFHEYKIRDVRYEADARGLAFNDILDFGSGVGNSVPYWRKYFPDAAVTCADRSLASLEVSRNRHDDHVAHVRIAEDSLPRADASFDLVFAACVFHHIPETRHGAWLEELRRVARPGGTLIIFEHNPLNPLTVSAVRNCPFDVDAKLIGGGEFRRRVEAAGWSDAHLRFRLFVPGALSFLRPLERYLVHLPLGAQYYVIARCP